MTAVVINLFGKTVVAQLPPMVTTTGSTLNLCEEPIVSARCATLVPYDGKRSFPCGGLLAYQGGQWQHVNACENCYASPLSCPSSIGHRSCDTPQPVQCLHVTCTMPADIDVQCTNGAAGECCGCCWIDDGHTDVDDGAGWAPVPSRWAL